MQTYALQDMSLVLEYDTNDPPEGLEQLLEDLSFVRATPQSGMPSFRMTVRVGSGAMDEPAGAREVFHLDGFRGLERATDFILTDGSSMLRLHPGNGVAEVRVAPDFWAKPDLLKRNFWSFGLMKLMRARGVFILHAAALARSPGGGLLLVARPGSGKSTLAIGLIRRGWDYLSDDAVLLRREERDGSVGALALRKHFYVDSSDAKARYADLRCGTPVADADGGRRQRVDIEGGFPGRFLPAIQPRTLLFPRIERRSRSILEVLDTAHATRSLLKESGPQLFDRTTMPAHLDVVRDLVAQCGCYRLRAGSDLCNDPGMLESLLPFAGNDVNGTNPR